MRQKVDENGELVFDEQGNPVMEEGEPNPPETPQGGEPPNPPNPPTPDPQEELIKKVLSEAIPQISQAVTQSVQSFNGRKMKEFKDEIMGLIPQPGAAPTPTPAPSEFTIDTTELLNDPAGVLTKVVRHINSQDQEQSNLRSQAFVKKAGAILDADPMFEGDDGKKLGDEVIAELSKLPVNPMLDPEVQAELNVAKAKNVVLARKLTPAKPVTALDKNKPGAVQTSVSSASPAPVRKVQVKVDDDVRARGRRMGWTDEEIDAALAEE